LSRAELKRLKEARALIAKELPELIARDKRMKEASEESTVSGGLRRLIHASELSLIQIAARVGIPPLLLADFLTGDRTLRSDVIDRLAESVGYDLGRTRKSSNSRGVPRLGT
jgi:hypothetical protein